jgi:aminopeptidase N
VIEDSAGPIKVQSWAYRDSLALAREKFTVTPRVIEMLQRKLNAPLPDRHFTQAVVPDFIFWTWLEQWRPLIATSVHDDRLILADQQGWPGEQREMAIARMVAQEWFGKSLAPRDWSELWLSDGFVNFMAQVYYEEAHREATSGGDAAFGIRQWASVSVFAADRDARRPLVYDRWLYGPIELLLTEHASQKGAVVLQLLRHELGDSVFWQGMHDYVTRYAGQPVTTADFRQTMETASGRDLGPFFRQWITGAGFPFLRIAYDYDAADHRVTLTIRQVQRRDESTGFFDTPVDVIVGTTQGEIRASVPLHGEMTTYSIPIQGSPVYVQWDPGKWLPSDVKFPRSTALLLGQLEHAPLGGRLDALQGLAERAQAMGGRSFGFTGTNAPPTGDREALAAIIHVARSDSSLGVRAEAIQSMMGLFDDSARAALIEFTHDTSAEIRAIAARMLFGPFPDGLARLRDLADGDPNQGVRSTAAQALSMMRIQEPQQRIADSVIHSPTASDAERASAAAELTNSFLPGAWDAGRHYLTAASSSRAVRQAVMRQMGIGVRYQFRPEANADELIALLRPFLNSEDPSLRLAAAREFSSTNIPAARTALEERKRVEVDARVLRTIDESLGEMAKERFRPPGAPRK